MSGRAGKAEGVDRLAAVERLCREGRELSRSGERAAALESYLKAWELIPEPRSSFGASTFILSALGGLLSEAGDLSEAVDVLVRSSGRTAGGAALGS
ncbi:MAG TPA: hypothetical protein VFG59_01700 [Anaeromyxobacter sp.]|nr:hypothetical protein [Anaeromyxobacter sp.]